MAYREISLPAMGETTCTFEYVIGRWNTKIKGIGVFENHVIGSTVGNPEDEKVSVTPKDIQRAILMSPRCPPHVKKARDWDKPPFPGPKKVDPGPRTRGFANLLQRKIVAIDACAVNVIVLECDEGGRYEISAETGIGAIPVITCSVKCLTDPDYD
jgi:hypothetical protein